MSSMDVQYGEVKRNFGAAEKLGGRSTVRGKVRAAHEQQADPIDQLPRIGEVPVSPVHKVQNTETEQHQRDDTVQHGFAANIELHLL